MNEPILQALYIKNINRYLGQIHDIDQGTIANIWITNPEHAAYYLLKTVLKSHASDTNPKFAGLYTASRREDDEIQIKRINPTLNLL